MKLTFLGHSAVLVESSLGRVIFDPFLTDNPVATVDPATIDVDAVLITHGHGDHVGDAEAIARSSDALLVSTFEVATYFGNKGLQTHPMHIGGAHQFDFGWVKLVHAEHGTGYVDGEQIIYMGDPAGMLYRADGTTILHAGDTGLFGDMRLIGDRHEIDVALVPIGDNFTMGPDDALAAVEFLQPKVVIPVHYNTFELIAQDGEAFAEAVRKTGRRCHVLAPNESVEV